MTEARFGLTDEQMALLLSPLHPGRVQQDNKGMSHLAGWDVRRWLTRIFGPVGWSDKTLSTDLVNESKIKLKNGRDGWQIIYRVEVRLTVKNIDGIVLTTFEDGAVGDANLPDLAQAHDMAFKTALTQALKRCAMNLGDQFGLSLYNKGSVDPVVVRTAVWNPPQDVEAPSIAGASEDVQGDEEMITDDEGDDYSATIGADADAQDTILFDALKQQTQGATTVAELAAAGDRVKASLKRLSQAQIKELQRAWKEANTMLIMASLDDQIESMRLGFEGSPPTREAYQKVMGGIEKADLDPETHASFVKQLNEAFNQATSYLEDASAPQ